ncbi:hypothetical protein GXW82_26095 [Streptacidiphilus sp. 4-A2]|nr:hypothetical protein [Streptacidiphilus sp. 4-A2]
MGGRGRLPAHPQRQGGPAGAAGPGGRRPGAAAAGAGPGQGQAERPDGERAGQPVGAEEEQLAGIWRELLKLERQVGRADNFFDLGGHSLLANKVVAQVRRRMGVSVPLDAVFDYPTVAELAAVLCRLRDGSSVAEKV